MQAQSSNADIIAIASPVSDLQNLMKQGGEFNVFSGKQKVAAMPMMLADVHSVGLGVTQGTILSSIFYWDGTPGSREFAKKFVARMGRPPSETQAMNYSATLHYRRSIEAAKTDEVEAVIKQMRSTPVNDAVTTNANIRADGRLMRDISLVRVKTPAESKRPWDYFEVLSPIKAENAFRPIEESSCALLKRS